MVGNNGNLVAGIRFKERGGTAETLIFLHGIGSNAGSFAGLTDLLPPDSRLIAWNAPGYGGSVPLPVQSPTAADYAYALHSFLTELGVERPIIVGHSLGTLIGAEYARLFPEQVRQLILSASACGYAIQPGAMLPDKVAARITDLETLGSGAFAQSRAPRLIHDPENNPDLVERVTQSMAAVDPAGYAQAVHMLASGNLEASLQGVSVPCDFIIGEEDIVTPRAQTDRAATALPTDKAPQIIAIKGAGHALYLQRPQEFVQALMQLIADQADRQTPPNNRRERHD